MSTGMATSRLIVSAFGMFTCYGEVCDENSRVGAQPSAEIAAADGSRARIRDRDPASFDTEALRQLVDLRVAHESALDAGRLARVHRLIQHVAAAQQLLGATGVENDAAVDLRADCERDTRRDVGLDEACDDVGRRSLCGDDQVDADRAR